MKRDQEFIREYLLELENSDGTQFPHTDILWHDGKEVEVLPDGWNWKKNYHYELMKDAGWVVELEWDFPGTGNTGIVAQKKFRLSNSAHDYLDAIRDEGIWSKTREIVHQSGGNVTMEVIKKLAVGLLKNKIRQHTDIEI